MRFIDADALIPMIDAEIKFLEETKAKTEKEYQGGFSLRIAEANLIKQHIQNMPTAYDVEAVVAELEKEKEIHTEHFRISLYKDYPEIKKMYEKVCLVIDKAISIVRGKE